MNHYNFPLHRKCHALVVERNMEFSLDDLSWELEELEELNLVVLSGVEVLEPVLENSVVK